MPQIFLGFFEDISMHVDKWDLAGRVSARSVYENLRKLCMNMLCYVMLCYVNYGEAKNNYLSGSLIG